MYRAWLYALLCGAWTTWAARYVGTDLSGQGHHRGVSRPFSARDRIAVIGGGPAGVHMASRLAQLLGIC